MDDAFLFGSYSNDMITVCNITIIMRLLILWLNCMIMSLCYKLKRIYSPCIIYHVLIIVNVIIAMMILLIINFHLFDTLHTCIDNKLPIMHLYTPHPLDWTRRSLLSLTPNKTVMAKMIRVHQKPVFYKFYLYAAIIVTCNIQNMNIMNHGSG